ncbi:MAG TPA: cold-shock protein [Solibacterales bacterium]|nr:cold-shock protein [Bryobacterales bacterium]
MRFEGKLDKWNDDRGYGFITPTRGGEPVFVHISAFPRDGRRPQVGEALTFEVEPAGDGKKRAINVARPGAAPRPRAPVAPRDTSTRPHRPARRGSFAGTVIGALLLAGVGAFAFVQFNAARSGGRPSMDSVPAPSAAQQSFQSFRCDGRTHCSQMTSCEEAKFFLKNCPGTKMDGDGDGVPCEMQWCSSPLGR